MRLRSAVPACVILLLVPLFLDGQQTAPAPASPASPSAAPSAGAGAAPASPSAAAASPTPAARFPAPGLSPGPAQGRPGYGLPADSLRGLPANDPLNYAAWGGRVVLESGGPPPARAAIDMRCGPRLTRVAYTRPDGTFVYRELVAAADARSYSRSNSAFADLHFNLPNTEMGVLRADAKDCQLRAVLAGYSSSVAFPFRERGQRQPADVITLVLRKNANVAGTVSAASAPAPPAARKAYEKGLAEAEKGALEKAAVRFREAVGIYPAYAAAWYELGIAEARRERPEGAREAWSRAVAADPDYAPPYLQLAASAMAAQDWPEVARLGEAVIRINPDDFPGAYMYRATAEYRMGRPEAAESSLREEMKRDPQGRYPEAHFMLGNILGKRGDYAGAAAAVRSYLAAAPEGRHAARARELLAGIEASAAAR